MFVLTNSIAAFLNTFTKIKNVDFSNSEGLSELNKFHIDETSFDELGELGHFATSIAAGSIAGKGLEEAKSHAAEADVICTQLEMGAMQCIAIRRRTYMFHNLLARLDAYFLPLIHAMEEVVEKEGIDYAKYSVESRKVIASAAATAISIKAVLDTPILTAEGAVTDESEAVTAKLIESIDK